MVVFASSRASWLLSLAVLGLACTGTREDPSPGDAPLGSVDGSQGTGGSGGGGGSLTIIGGGSPGGAGSGIPFADCGCASIVESNNVPLCNQCVDVAIAAGQPCETLLAACTGDPDCSLARTLLANNDCGGDPTCTATAITGILDQDSADLLFGYYSCICEPCALCVPGNGAGGGGVGGSGFGGAPAGNGQCTVSPQ